ncbi:MAG: UDP-N-acetylenolpyruvoylglucosamine reductase [Gammaproteobacteria bacterium RIFCSPLOWO2_02_FULL_56_15]|nr:MAG: UDP-N-acetylenolpyruvoylglucosamine reductase [Gammaproteobacteria bacterium RIFCSPLOWO2_02_FULL_56_15]
MISAATMINGLNGTMKLREPMARHSSWRAGGPADRFYIPANLQDLCDFLCTLDPAEPLLWVGLGSNLLVRDGGFHGTVIAVSGVLGQLEIRADGAITAGAGVSCPKLARFTVSKSLSGAEFLAGIPGTVGGALAMNAGAFGGETWGIVSSAQTVDRSGRLRRRSRAELKPGYRSVDIPEGEWFVSAEFRLVADDSGQGEQRIRELLAQRALTQPLGDASCGSVFRNPPGDSAGRLIDACGLKGLRSGNAVVSDKHANFIINLGGATATDIERLICMVQQRVNQDSGILLEPEVRIVGHE